jgi:hypothetical protein
MSYPNSGVVVDSELEQTEGMSRNYKIAIGVSVALFAVGMIVVLFLVFTSSCEPGMVPSDLGFPPTGDVEYRGYYATGAGRNCGKKNKYCRWTGNGGHGGDPSKNTTFLNDSGVKSTWACTTPDGQYGNMYADNEKWGLTIDDRSDTLETFQ